MVILISLLVAIIGVLLYALASNSRLSEIGKILFFTGMLVTLLAYGAGLHQLAALNLRPLLSTNPRNIVPVCATVHEGARHIS